MSTCKHYLYPIWNAIRQRCTNPRNRSYHNYGGRGIRIHEEWLNSSSLFLEWVDNNLGPRPDGHELDRINNDGNYEPGNLRWADRSTQARNRRQHKGFDRFDNRSSHYGATRLKSGRWQASYGRNGKQYYLGVFATSEEASEAVNKHKQEQKNDL